MEELSKILKSPIFIVIVFVQLFIFPSMWFWIENEEENITHQSDIILRKINEIINSNINIKIDITPNAIKRYHQEKLINMLDIALLRFPQTIYPVKYKKYQEKSGDIRIKKEQLLQLARSFNINKFYIDVKIVKDNQTYTLPVRQPFRIIQSAEDDFEVVVETPIVIPDEENDGLKENINRLNEELKKIKAYLAKMDEYVELPIGLYLDTSKTIENTIQAVAIITLSFEPTINEVITREINFNTIIMPSNYTQDDKDIAILVNPYYLSDVFREFRMVRGDDKFQIAKNMFYAMKALGIRYVYSPTSTDTLSQYIQPPHYTILTKSGQCTDLSLLYATMLESFDIPTAFVFIPGHVFVMFEVDENKIPPAFKRFVVEYLSTNYLPVETTLIEHGFLTAVISGYNNYEGYKRVILTRVIWEETPPLNYSISEEKKKEIVNILNKKQLQGFLSSKN